MATILIAGCGRLGMQLGQCLQQQGYEVIGLRRSWVDMPFQRLQADLSQPISPAILPAKLDYVVYSATPDQRTPEAYQTAYVDGLSHLLDALPLATLQHFFFVSSTAVYGQTDGSWVNEDSDTSLAKFNGQIVLAAEQTLMATEVAATAVRFGGIYGGGRGRLLSKVRQGAEAQYLPPNYTNRIHQDDCVGVLDFLINLKQTQAKQLAPCYLAVDSDPAAESEVYQWLAQELQAPAPIMKNVPQGSSNKRCSNQRLLALGYQFKYPGFRQGYSAILKQELAAPSANP